MKKQWRLSLGLLFMLGSTLFLPKTALAFSCTSNGVSIGGTGTFTIPIDMTLNKDTSNIILTDMGAFTKCVGQVGYMDALQVIGASISSSFTGLGYSGFSMINGVRYNFPLGSVCIWPDANCTTNYPNLVFTPVPVKLGMERQSITTGTGVTLPAGSEIARLQVQQRSYQGQVLWGWQKTWIFTLKSQLVVPAYTCTISNPNQTVILPAVNKVDLQNNGEGKYPTATPFSFNLDCDPQTTVSVQFDGATMPGKNDVLANSLLGNDSIGIQVISNGTPVILGQTLQVIGNSQAQEIIAFDAHYYYNGGPVSAGRISSVATLSFKYN